MKEAENAPGSGGEGFEAALARTGFVDVLCLFWNCFGINEF